jgi:hypothetical protein
MSPALRMTPCSAEHPRLRSMVLAQAGKGAS